MKLVLILAGLGIVGVGAALGTWLVRDVAKDGGEPGEVQWLRMEILEEGSSPVPFLLGIPGVGATAYLQNGEERMSIDIVARDPWKFRVPVFGTSLEVRKDGDDSFVGVWKIPFKGDLEFPLRGRVASGPLPSERFPGDAAPAADLSGKWRVEINTLGVGRAVFRQDPNGNIEGTLIPPEIGDTRYLSGRVIGNRFQLSTFNGIQAFLVEGTIEDDGRRLEGTWTFVAINQLQIRATRGDEPSVASLVSVHLKEGHDRVTLPELADYRGTPVIVDFFGTWCSACLDLTPELVTLKRKFGDQGLEILSIALEPEGDDEATKRRVAEFREKYQVDWPISVRTFDVLIDELPSELEGVVGFPVTIFVRRDGTVAGVHTSFVSDAARPEHKEVLDRFEQWAREIVDSHVENEERERGDPGAELDAAPVEEAGSP